MEVNMFAYNYGHYTQFTSQHWSAWYGLLCSMTKIPVQVSSQASTAYGQFNHSRIRHFMARELGELITEVCSSLQLFPSPCTYTA